MDGLSGTLDDILVRTGDGRVGEDYLHQALSIHQQQAPTNYFAITSLVLHLSQTLLAHNRVREAEETVLKVYDAAKSTLSDKDSLIGNLAANLIKIYGTEGKTDAPERLKSPNP